MIYTTGFFITSNFEALQKVCRLAVDNNVPLAFNIAAVFLLQFEAEKVKECLDYASYVFCNEDEASAYAKLYDLPETDYMEIAKHIANRPTVKEGMIRYAIVT
jgi:adenosine kinase